MWFFFSLWFLSLFGNNTYLLFVICQHALFGEIMTAQKVMYEKFGENFLANFVSKGFLAANCSQNLAEQYRQKLQVRKFFSASFLNLTVLYIRRRFMISDDSWIRSSCLVIVLNGVLVVWYNMILHFGFHFLLLWVSNYLNLLFLCRWSWFAEQWHQSS